METIDFGATYSALTGEHVGEWYVPYTTCGESGELLIDDIPHARAGDWHALTGHRSYAFGAAASDPIFDPAETATDEQIREWVREAGGDVFAVVPVDSPCDDGCQNPDDCHEYGHTGAPAGWAVIYRDADA